MTYSQDKDNLLKWALTLIVSANLGVLISINVKMEKWMEVSISSQKDIEFGKLKDVEQDARMDKHDAKFERLEEQGVFLKPEETKIKYTNAQ